jgi:hypothetical protein
VRTGRGVFPEVAAMDESNRNLTAFAAHVHAAPADEKSEWVVRAMLEGTAQNCPMDVLVRLGECLVECRKSELRGEAESN